MGGPSANRRRLIALTLSLVLFGAACGGDDDSPATKAAAQNPNAGGDSGGDKGGTGATGPAPTAPDTADRLRASLQAAFQQHVLYAALATNAIIGARPEDAKAATQSLDANGVDIDVEVEKALGIGAGEQFLPLWKKHVGFIADYATAAAAGDAAKQTKAVTDLTGYADDFGAFLNSVVPELDKAAVADLIKSHITTVKGVIDAQAAKNQGGAYQALHPAVEHMGMVASAVAGGIIQHFPGRMTGNVTSAANELIAKLNTLFGENSFYILDMTDAMIANRPEEVTAASAALDAATASLVALLTEAGGANLGKAFEPVWRAHIASVKDLASAVGTNDAAKKAAALAALGGDTLQFAGFTANIGTAVAGALPTVNATQVSESARTYIQPLKDAINNQGIKRPTLVLPNAKTASNAMSTMAKLIGDALVKQNPSKYPA